MTKFTSGGMVMSTVLALGVLNQALGTGETDVTCRPMREIYANGKELCEKMWNDAFVYDDNETHAYTMWFFDAENNPNDDVSALRGLLEAGEKPDECKLQYFHKGAPGPEPDGFTECHPWKKHSCCNSAVAENYTHLRDIYGPEYRWDRCGPMSQECERFFVQEACFYECEANAGFFKKHPNGEAEEGGNDWQMLGMPIKASYCDAFFTACADNYFCGHGSFFECAKVYAEQDQSTVTVTVLVETSSDDDDGLGGGVIVAIVVGAVLLICACGTLAFFVMRERAGKPVFAPFEDHQSKRASPAAGGQTLGSTSA